MGHDLFEGFFKKGDFGSLATLSALTWLFSTIIFKLFAVESTVLKILIPLVVALCASWVREIRAADDHKKHYVFRIIANGCILFLGAVMTSKTFHTLGKLPTIDFAMILPEKGTHAPQADSKQAQSSRENPNFTSTFQFWYGSSKTSINGQNEFNPDTSPKGEDKN